MYAFSVYFNVETPDSFSVYCRKSKTFPDISTSELYVMIHSIDVVSKVPTTIVLILKHMLSTYLNQGDTSEPVAQPFFCLQELPLN